MKSIFPDKEKKPTQDDLINHLGGTFKIWQDIKDCTLAKYPKATEEWNYSSSGWSFRLKDKKRAIIYLLPRQGFFKVAFVFGQKAVDRIMDSDADQFIKSELQSARPYVEGRGIRIDVKDHRLFNDIKFLIEVKLSH